MSENTAVLVCEDCTTQRRQDWQRKNKKTQIRQGDLVKIAFRQNGHVEWMWIEVEHDLGDTKLEGTLINDPVLVDYIKKGQTFTFYRAEIADLVWKEHRP